MRVAQWLELLEKRGFRFMPDGDGLEVEGPEALLTPRRKALLARRKAEIIAYLREREAATVTRVKELLAERGWVAVRSKVLGEVVIWTRDGKVAVPERWHNAVRYTLAELEVLTRDKPGPEDLRAIHKTKRAFEGTLEAQTPPKETQETPAEAPPPTNQTPGPYKETRDWKACLAHARTPPPPGACPVCRETAWWTGKDGQKVCSVCHPPTPKEEDGRLDQKPLPLFTGLKIHGLKMNPKAQGRAVLRGAHGDAPP